MCFSTASFTFFSFLKLSYLYDFLIYYLTIDKTILFSSNTSSKTWVKSSKCILSICSKYWKLSIVEIYDEQIPNNLSTKTAENIKEIEGNKILAHIKNSYVIALDLKGKQYLSLIHISEPTRP